MSQPCVIAISGFVGSGKSTVSTALAQTLGDAPILMIDHYEHCVAWPQDMRQWVQDGADPGQIRIPKLKDDLLSLRNGQTIIDPFDGRIIKPSNHIILEEPSGRERQEISEYIDLVIFIDVPQDVCVIRMIERVLNMELWKPRGTFEGETSENLVQQLDAVAMWVTQYQRARSMYMKVSQLVRAKADIVVNGMNTIDEITSDILHAIKEKQSAP